MQYGTSTSKHLWYCNCSLAKQTFTEIRYTDITSQPIESQTSIKITSMLMAFLGMPLRNLVNGYQMSNKLSAHPLYTH